jgi:hypothetical protein
MQVRRVVFTQSHQALPKPQNPFFFGAQRHSNRWRCAYGAKDVAGTFVPSTELDGFV